MRNHNFVNAMILSAVIVIIAACCCSCKPTGSQLRAIIQNILFEDRKWEAVLSERVRLNRNDPTIQSLDIDYWEIDLEDIDPLKVLQQLMRPTEHFFGSELTLSAYIVDTAIMCLTFKHVSVHVALIGRMLALEPEKRKNVFRANVFANLLPREVDVLSSIEKRYLELLKVYDKIAPIVEQELEKFDGEQYARNLKDEMDNINAIIGNSCKNSDMKIYFRQLKFPSMNTNNLVDVIGENNTITENVDLNTIVSLLKDNENAIFKMYEDMYELRNLGMHIWKGILNYPDLPTDGEELKWNTRPSYHEMMSNILRRKPQHFMTVPANVNANTGVQFVEYSPGLLER
ncbi:Hypothetical protein CINCED_3A000967 [Cinara cedri]|uniref:Uncharacterized protein n=1 Tax=Cinara cedri TaxID=506608 RepID=A0A5E4N6A3_9HEMI|nr:Hypothetical protein CINCED_3A000967 [Cinara cedri]